MLFCLERYLVVMLFCLEHYILRKEQLKRCNEVVLVKYTTKCVRCLL